MRCDRAGRRGFVHRANGPGALPNVPLDSGRLTPVTPPLFVRLPRGGLQLDIQSPGLLSSGDAR